MPLKCLKPNVGGFVFCRVLGAPQMPTCLERWCLALWPWATRAPHWKFIRSGKINFLLLVFSEDSLLSADKQWIEWHKCTVKGISVFALKSVWCHFWNKRLLCSVMVNKIWRAEKWKAKAVLALFLTDIFPPVPQLPSPAHAQQGVHSSHRKQHLRQSEHVSPLHFVAIAQK